MTTKFIPGLVLATGLLTQGVRSEEPVLPPTPAPSSAAPLSLQAPDQIVYTAVMPSVADLNTSAAAQGLAVLQISPSAVQTTVVYRYPDGKTRVVAYQLPPPGNTSSSTTVVTAPPAVVYDLPPPVVNYYYDPLYPRYVYPPVSLHVGFGAGRHHWR